MEPRQNQLDAGYFVFWMDVDRHAAAIINDLHRTVFQYGDFDFPGVARERFIHAVVDHLLHQMIGPGGVGVHAGSPANGFETRQNL